MKKDKIYLIVIGVLSLLILVLIVFNLFNNEKDSYTCKKNNNQNGIEYESKFMFDIGENGQVLNLKEENKYVKLTDENHKKLMETVYVNSDGTLTHFECDDTFKDNKKVTCKRNLDTYKIDNYDISESWYIEYLNQLKENGYICK